MDPIKDARDNFLRAKGQLEKAFANVPDDRVNWAPSPTARTPVHQVAHSAESIHHIKEMLDGRPFAEKNIAIADRGFREREAAFDSREAALAELNRTSDAYIAFLDGLTADRLDEMITLPFGLGEMPLVAGLSAAADHTRWHAAQLEYIQTIYGDHDWHF